MAENDTSWARSLPSPNRTSTFAKTSVFALSSFAGQAGGRSALQAFYGISKCFNKIKKAIQSVDKKPDSVIH